VPHRALAATKKRKWVGKMRGFQTKEKGLMREYIRRRKIELKERHRERVREKAKGERKRGTKVVHHLLHGMGWAGKLANVDADSKK